MLVSFLAGAVLFAQGGDSAAKAAYDAWLEKLSSVRSVTGTIELQPSEPNGKPTPFSIKMLRPRLFQVTSEHQQWHYDGKTLWTYMPARKQFVKAEPKVAQPPLVHGFEAMFGAVEERMQPKQFRMEGLDGKQYPAAILEPEGQLQIAILIDPATKTPVAWKQTYAEQTMVAKYKDLKLNAPLAPKEFAWNPPADAKPYEAPDFTKSLLKVGTTAPDFKLATPQGGELSLKEAYQGKKGTLINFWFYG